MRYDEIDIGKRMPQRMGVIAEAHPTQLKPGSGIAKGLEASRKGLLIAAAMHLADALERYAHILPRIHEGQQLLYR